MDIPWLYKLAGLSVALLGLVISLGLTPRVVANYKSKRLVDPKYLIAPLPFLYYAILLLAVSGPKILWPLLFGYGYACIIGTILLIQCIIYPGPSQKQ